MVVIKETDIIIATVVISFTTGLIGAVLGLVLSSEKQDRINELENRIHKLEDEVDALDEVVDVLISELKKAEVAATPAGAVAPTADAAEAAPAPDAADAAPLEKPVPEESISDAEIITEKGEHRTEKTEREFQEVQSTLHTLFFSGATALAVAGLASWTFYMYESPLLRGAAGRIYEVY